VSQWVTLTLRCDAEGCGEEFPSRISERLRDVRARAAEQGWTHGTKVAPDLCAEHARPLLEIVREERSKVRVRLIADGVR